MYNRATPAQLYAGLIGILLGLLGMLAGAASPERGEPPLA